MRGTRAALAWNTCVPRERVRTTLASDGARAATLCSIHNQGESVYSNGAMFVTRRLLHLAPLLAALALAACGGEEGTVDAGLTPDTGTAPDTGVDAGVDAGADAGFDAGITCGDGIISAGETCDDGATVSGDGCSDMCAVEPGYACTGAPSVCTTLCGDGVIAGAEACDDGAAAPGDGCSDN
ncbi:MAG: DUF4215 domain-containing protein, partial [Myxococcales bacterium]|nr:DUF4215 domain-containing protein [Myxococcales bacterium]